MNYLVHSSTSISKTCKFLCDPLASVCKVQIVTIIVIYQTLRWVFQYLELEI